MGTAERGGSSCMAPPRARSLTKGSACQLKQGSACNLKQGSACNLEKGSARELKQGSACKLKQGSACELGKASPVFPLFLKLIVISLFLCVAMQLAALLSDAESNSLDPGVLARHYGRQQSGAGGEGEEERRLSAYMRAHGNILESTTQTSTPYGRLVQTMELERTGDRDPLVVKFVPPRALIWVALRTSDAFAAFLAESLPDGRSDVCCYNDEVRPGNAQRPDWARLYVAFYYQFLHLPEHFRTSDLGWMDFSFVLVKDCEHIRGGVGRLNERLMNAMGFPIVVEIPEGRPRPANGVASYTFDFKMLMADEKAIKQLTGVAGASSYHPCLCCANILGRVAPALVGDADGYMQHYVCSEVDRFDRYTFQRFDAVCQEIAAAWAQSPARGREAELLYSIHYNDGLSILFSPLARICRVPECVNWDAMHSIWASGGVAQYQINQFAHQMKLCGVSLADFDEFARLIRLKGESYRMRLSSRLKRGDDAHLRAFANESLALVTCLTVFSDAVLVPAGVMAEHVQCLRLLYTMQCILFMGDAARQHARLLGILAKQHLDLYLRLYPRCRKPKNHYVMHLAEQIERFQRVVTCFSAERHHKLSKHIATHSYKNVLGSMQRQMLMLFLHRVREKRRYEAWQLRRPLQSLGLWAALITELGATPLQRGNACQCSGLGTLKKHDLAAYRAGDGALAFGIVLEFYRADVNGAEQLFAILQLLAIDPADGPHPDASHADLQNTAVAKAAHVTRLVGTLPHTRDGDRVRAYLPMHHRQLLAA